MTMSAVIQSQFLLLPISMEELQNLLIIRGVPSAAFNTASMVELGSTYLVKYVVTDIEGTVSRPAVAAVKTSEAHTEDTDTRRNRQGNIPLLQPQWISGEMKPWKPLPLL